MNKIEVGIIAHDLIATEKLMVTGARLTQHGEKIKNLNDFIELFNKPYSDKLVENLSALPHPTLQKLGTISIVVVGASRRFLAQITRHQNEVKFVSASLQYSDMSNEARFVVPYGILLDADAHDRYLDSCRSSFEEYETLIRDGVDHDEAAYCMPQGMRNTLIISATPYQWKHMIRQRTCHRNTLEMRWVMLLCWHKLYSLWPEVFKDCGPFCTRGPCEEGRMWCGSCIPKSASAEDILREDFPIMFEHFDITL